MHITNTDTGTVGYAYVADMCPGCPGGSYSLGPILLIHSFSYFLTDSSPADLATDFYYQMGGTDFEGHFDVSWNVCNV
jgi:hypothetical protein